MPDSLHQRLSLIEGLLGISFQGCQGDPEVCGDSCGLSCPVVQNNVQSLLESTRSLMRRTEFLEAWILEMERLGKVSPLVMSLARLRAERRLLAEDLSHHQKMLQHTTNGFRKRFRASIERQNQKLVQMDLKIKGLEDDPEMA
jgi:hypothetical protein